MAAQVAADLLIEAVGRALHIPDLCAPPGAKGLGGALDGESRNPALPLNLFRRLRVCEGEELVEPQHILVVVTEAGLRDPRPAAQRVLGCETLLVVVVGAVVSPVEVRSGIGAIRSIPRISHRQVAALGHQEVAFDDKVVLRARALACALEGPDILINYATRSDDRQGWQRQRIQ